MHNKRGRPDLAHFFQVVESVSHEILQIIAHLIFDYIANWRESRHQEQRARLSQARYVYRRPTADASPENDYVFLFDADYFVDVIVNIERVLEDVVFVGLERARAHLLVDAVVSVFSRRLILALFVLIGFIRFAGGGNGRTLKIIGRSSRCAYRLILMRHLQIGRYRTRLAFQIELPLLAVREGVHLIDPMHLQGSVLLSLLVLCSSTLISNRSARFQHRKV